MPPTSSGETANNATTAKVVAAVLLALGLVIASLWLGDRLSLARLVQWEQQARLWQDSHPVLMILAALGLYIAVAGLSLPGATPLTLLYGWFFGFATGLVLVSFGSTAGATLAFLSSRYLLRDAIERRFGSRLTAINEAIRREGAVYLLTARLIPGIPFVVINLVMGLTPLRAGTFWWVSQIGMLPATAIYVWAGAAFPDLQTLAEHGLQSVLAPKLIAALICLGLFPLVVTRIRSRLRG